MIEIEIDRSSCNSLVFELEKAKTRFIISYGGAGSGKSYSQAQYEIGRCLQEGKVEKTLIIRKYGTTLRDSVVYTIRKADDFIFRSQHVAVIKVTPWL